MDIFNRLAETVRQQNEQGELPDFVVPLLMQVANDPERFADRLDLVTELTTRVAQYETYSEMCCEKMGFGLEDIHTILDRLRVSY